MIRLVVNADDLGLHPGIDEGIFRAHTDGVVTSTTVLVRGRTAPDAIARAARDGLAVGLHVALTHLRPAADPADVPTLAPGGILRPNVARLAAALAAGRIRHAEIDREVRAQIALARTLGARLDHLDGHQHVHALPGVRGIVRRIAREEELALRTPSERPRPRWLARPIRAVGVSVLSALAGTGDGGVRTAGVFDSGRLDEARLLGILAALPEGDHEIVCHPGLDVGRVDEDAGWTYDWEDELAALTSPRVKEALASRGIEPTTFGRIAASPRSWYDRGADRYDSRSRRGVVGALRRRERAAVMRLLAPRAGESILDVGCGSGFDAVPLSELGVHVVGIDLSPEMVRVARSRGLDARVADLETFDLGRTFDKVLACGSLELCDSRRALSRVAAHLAPGGSLVALFAVKSLLGGVYRAWHARHGVRVRLFSRESFAADLERAGMRLARWESATPYTAVALAVRRG